MVMAVVEAEEVAGEGAVGASLGFAFEGVAGVADPDAGTVVGAGHRALALLDDVDELVGQRVPVETARAGDDVVARGVGTGTELGGGPLRHGVGVDAHVGEVGTKAALHVLADRGVERVAGPAQDVVGGGPLRGDQLGHRRVAQGALQLQGPVLRPGSRTTVDGLRCGHGVRFPLFGMHGDLLLGQR
jgi:hypothetical protein